MSDVTTRLRSEIHPGGCSWPDAPKLSAHLRLQNSDWSRLLPLLPHLHLCLLHLSFVVVLLLQLSFVVVVLFLSPTSLSSSLSSTLKSSSSSSFSSLSSFPPHLCLCLLPRLPLLLFHHLCVHLFLFFTFFVFSLLSSPSSSSSSSSSWQL